MPRSACRTPIVFHLRCHRKVDDGLSVERLSTNGGVTERVWVHIADVSRWIPEGSALSAEAKQRRTTVYLPEGSMPMFPPDIARDLLSLR